MIKNNIKMKRKSLVLLAISLLLSVSIIGFVMAGISPQLTGCCVFPPHVCFESSQAECYGFRSGVIFHSNEGCNDVDICTPGCCFRGQVNGHSCDDTYKMDCLNVNEKFFNGTSCSQISDCQLTPPICGGKCASDETCVNSVCVKSRCFYSTFAVWYHNLTMMTDEQTTKLVRPSARVKCVPLCSGLNQTSCDEPYYHSIGFVHYYGDEQQVDCICEWGAPPQNILDIEASVPTLSSSSNSYLFIKNSSQSMDDPSFLNGIVYAVEPHGYSFNKPVDFTMLYNGQTWDENSGLTLFKVTNDSMADMFSTINGSECKYQKLGENSQTIDSSGGIISLDDLTVNIPGEALNEGVNFNITKYFLDCGCGDGICSEDESASTCFEDCFKKGNSSVVEAISSINSSFKLVIGAMAAPEDNIAAIDIAGAFNIENTILDSQATLDDNLIIIGGPCVNSKAAELLGLNFPACGADSGVPEKKGVIDVFTENGKTQILISGWDAIDTRVAARVLVRNNEFTDKLNKNPSITFGTLDNLDVE